MELISRIDGRLYLSVLAMKIVLNGLFLASPVRSWEKKKVPVQAIKDSFKLVESIVAYRREVLKSAEKAVRVVEETEKFVKALKDGSKKEKMMKDIEKAKKLAEEAKRDATEKLKSIEALQKKLKKAVSGGQGNSKEAAEGISEALKSLDESDKSDKDPKFFLPVILAGIVAVFAATSG